MTQLLLPIIYLAFISLGLPDSLLGSAWPTMYPQLGVPFSYAGILSMIISLGTIVSSLNSDRLTRALGTGKVTALSVGMTALLLPDAQVFALAGLVLVGLGCAPIYPSVIHSTPAHFGAQNSQAVIGIQMSSAYVGNLAMPPLFGLLANNITPALFPFYLLVVLVLMALMHRQLVRKTSC